MRWLFILGGVVVLLAGALALAWPHRIALPGMLDRWRDPIGETQHVVWDQGPQTTDTAPGERSPNVIVILVDDLGINDITTFGGGLAAGDVPTPNIDAIAANGAVFVNGYAGNAATAPCSSASGIWVPQNPSSRRTRALTNGSASIPAPRSSCRRAIPTRSICARISIRSIPSSGPI